MCWFQPRYQIWFKTIKVRDVKGSPAISIAVDDNRWSGQIKYVAGCRVLEVVSFSDFVPKLHVDEVATFYSDEPLFETHLNLGNDFTSYRLKISLIISTGKLITVSGIFEIKLIFFFFFWLTPKSAANDSHDHKLAGEGTSWSIPSWLSFTNG